MSSPDQCLGLPGGPLGRRLVLALLGTRGVPVHCRLENDRSRRGSIFMGYNIESRVVQAQRRTGRPIDSPAQRSPGLVINSSLPDAGSCNNERHPVFQSVIEPMGHENSGDPTHNPAPGYVSSPWISEICANPGAVCQGRAIWTCHLPSGACHFLEDSRLIDFYISRKRRVDCFQTVRVLIIDHVSTWHILCSGMPSNTWLTWPRRYMPSIPVLKNQAEVINLNAFGLW
jgi:hypothetical protein